MKHRFEKILVFLKKHKGKLIWIMVFFALRACDRMTGQWSSEATLAGNARLNTAITLSRAHSYANFDITNDRAYSQKEALRLYKIVMDDPKLESDDRAQAKIAYAELYSGSIKGDLWFDDGLIYEQHQAIARRLLNEVIGDSTISPRSSRIKTDAKQALAELYFYNNFEMSKAEAEKKALALYEDVFVETQKSPHLQADAKTKLAKAYIDKRFSISEVDAKQKAIALLTEVINGVGVSSNDRKRARIKRAEISVNANDPHRQEVLKCYIENPSNGILDKLDFMSGIAEPIEFKEELAEKYFKNYFNLDKNESMKKSIMLMNEIAYDYKTSHKNRVQHKIRLMEIYLNNQSHLSQAEAIPEAYKIALDIEKECMVSRNKYVKFPNQRGGYFVDDKTNFEALKNLAFTYAHNKFKLNLTDTPVNQHKMFTELLNKQDLIVAHKKAHELFNLLLSDRNLHPSNRATIREGLAHQYVWTRDDFMPENGKRLEAAALELYNEIINDPDQPYEKWFHIKMQIAYMYRHAKRLGINEVEAKETCLRLYNELLIDPKLTKNEHVHVQKSIADLQKEKFLID